MNEKKERREMVRQECRCEVNWSHFNKAFYSKGRVLNFCQAGSYLETDRPIDPGKTVLIRVLQCSDFICEHQEDFRFNAIAEVKWCREMNATEKTWYGVGVRYHFPA